jgi:protein-tyrosine phosphatase
MEIKEGRCMTGRIDVHSHLIPAVDDGCGSYAESVECARRMVAAGYTHSFCTPHIWPNLLNNTIDAIGNWTDQLQQKLDEAAVPLTLLPGGEINLRADIIEAIRPEKLVTYAMAGRHVLIDFWADRLPPHFEPSIRWMQSHGLTVILAHPERLRAVQDQPELADYFAGLGVLLQGNLQCFSDPPHALTRRTIERFLKEDRYFLLGSDLHKLETLPQRLAGLQRAIDLAGPETVDRLTIHHPRKLLPQSLRSA